MISALKWEKYVTDASIIAIIQLVTVHTQRGSILLFLLWCNSAISNKIKRMMTSAIIFIVKNSGDFVCFLLLMNIVDTSYHTSMNWILTHWYYILDERYYIQVFLLNISRISNRSFQDDIKRASVYMETKNDNQFLCFTIRKWIG